KSRPPRDLAELGVLEEGRDHVLVLGEVVEWTEVDVAVLDVRERRKDHESEHRQREDAPHRCGEPERGRLEEPGARERWKRLFRGHGRRGLVRDRARLRLDLGNLPADLAGDLSRPEQAEGDRERGTDRGDDPAYDEAEEEAV